MIDANPTELANDLRRIAKVSYGATIEEARSVIKTQRQAADLIEQQAARIVGLLDQHAGDSAELRLLCYERDKARERVKALEAKCGLLAASLAQSEGEVEERDTRIAALAPVATAVDAQPVAEAWQPIETAPKDRLIAIWIAGTNAAGQKWSDIPGELWVNCYYDRICGEWRTTRPSGHLRCVPERYVTHWQPLPAPPAALSQHTGDKDD